jgi:hypothetical protein
VSLSVGPGPKPGPPRLFCARVAHVSHRLIWVVAARLVPSTLYCRLWYCFAVPLSMPPMQAATLGVALIVAGFVSRFGRCRRVRALLGGRLNGCRVDRSRM